MAEPLGGERTIRRADASDAESIGLVHWRSAEAAYRGHGFDDRLDLMSPELRAERWRSTLAELDDRGAVYVLEDDGRVLGFAAVAASRDDDVADDTGEVWTLYVDPDAWRSGAGRALMERCVEHLRDVGFGQATLWVLDTNERALQFYEVMGWRPDGANKVIAAGAYGELRLARTL